MTLCGGSFYLPRIRAIVDICFIVKGLVCRDLERISKIAIITGMIFFPATPPDIDELVLFINGAYRGKSAELGWASEGKLISGQRIDADMLAEMLSAGDTILLMRDQTASPLAGCVSIKPTDNPSIWYLSMLAIDPLRQAEGLGRTLLSEAESRIKAQGATRVKITVIWVRQALLEWYERRGYQPTGQTEPFPYGNERIGVPLRDDLYFVELEKSLI
jgi:ribosomal protein S18 acetylase RimI-like enzyme